MVDKFWNLYSISREILEINIIILFVSVAVQHTVECILRLDSISEAKRATVYRLYRPLNSHSGVCLQPISRSHHRYYCTYMSHRIRTIGLQQGTSVWTSEQTVYPSRKEHSRRCRVSPDFAIFFKHSCEEFSVPALAILAHFFCTHEHICLE